MTSLYKDEICKVMFQFLEVQSCSRSVTCDLLVQSLDMQGICEEMLHCYIIGIAADEEAIG